jgi:hypothetical protein
LGEVTSKKLEFFGVGVVEEEVGGLQATNSVIATLLRRSVG